MKTYANAKFPLDTSLAFDGRPVRLFASDGFRVIGVVLNEGAFSSHHLWDEHGKIIGGPSILDLIPSPAKRKPIIDGHKAKIAEAKARLKANPDAPAEYRAVDEQVIADAQAAISTLGG